MILKVKEPQESELGYLRPGLVLFTYLHLAAYPAVAAALLEHEVTGIAYETVQPADGSLPLLAPMSEVAGRMATQVGARFLERELGGRGVLLGGVPGVRPARVVVIGAGNVGWNSAWIAQGMEAEVMLLDKNLDRLRWVDQIHQGRIVTLASNRGAVTRAVADADLVIGAVLVSGRTCAGRRHRRDGAHDEAGRGDRRRRRRPGRLRRDDARDDPFGSGLRDARRAALRVGNMPGAVPFTSTYALTNATLPYALTLAEHGVAGDRPGSRPANGVNTVGGSITHPIVAEALGKPYVPLQALAPPDWRCPLEPVAGDRRSAPGQER